MMSEGMVPINVLALNDLIMITLKRREEEEEEE